jgi:hypothetical protein
MIHIGCSSLSAPASSMTTNYRSTLGPVALGDRRADPTLRVTDRVSSLKKSINLLQLVSLCLHKLRRRMNGALATLKMQQGTHSEVDHHNAQCVPAGVEQVELPAGIADCHRRNICTLASAHIQ